MNEKKPIFKHDCDACLFVGPGVFMGRIVDWYTCETPLGRRTVVARYGDEGSRYVSGTIGETMAPSIVVLGALAQGLELNQAEKDKLLQTTLSMWRQSLGVSFWADCTDPNSDDHNQLGTANWLGIDL